MQHAGRSRLVGGALAVALLTASALARAPAPADAAKDEKIVFTSVSEKDKKVGIVVMNADGSQRTLLTKGEAMELDPALSPDGKRIAFITVNKDTMSGNLWVMKADGSERKQLTENAAKKLAFAPAWSPDGRKIAYSQMEPEGGGPPSDADVMIMDADGKNGKTLGKGLMPAWSPDGKKIVYCNVSKDGGFEPRLWIMDADGKNAKQLLMGRALMGAWSPDGKKLAYTGAEEGERPQPHIYVCKADGSEPKQITLKQDFGELAPRWSADGKRIYFSRVPFGGGPPEKGTLVVIDADGSNEKELSKGDGMEMLGGTPLFLFMGRAAARKP
jgi:TolB protein